MYYQIFMRGTDSTINKMIGEYPHEVVVRYQDETSLVSFKTTKPLSREQAEYFVKENVSDSSLLIQYEDSMQNINFYYIVDGEAVISPSLLCGAKPEDIVSYRNNIMQNEMKLVID